LLSVFSAELRSAGTFPHSLQQIKKNTSYHRSSALSHGCFRTTVRTAYMKINYNDNFNT